MARLLLLLIPLILVLVFAAGIRSVIRRRPRRPPRPPRPARRPGGYEFERRTDQVHRRLKGVKGQAEDREGIIGFLETHQGVEAYVEPRTVIHPLSVVLVAHDGEWRRFGLSDDRFLRELARARGVSLHDAVHHGYPQRMRDYERRRRRDLPPGSPPAPDDPRR